LSAVPTLADCVAGVTARIAYGALGASSGSEHANKANAPIRASDNRREYFIT
jgi:hypothetical protein